MADYRSLAKKNIEAFGGKYTALADPEKYIEVDPLAIGYHCPFHMATKRTQGSKFYDWGKVMEGDWDLDLRDSLNTEMLAEVLAKHFIEGLTWEQTGILKRKMRRIEKYGKIDGCATYDELVDRYARLDTLYQSICSAGRLKSAAERGAPLTDDLFVSIGRDGRFLFAQGGSHRLAIAKILRLPTIPVRVAMRHEEWQKIREAVKAGTKEAPPHPDLVDLQGVPIQVTAVTDTGEMTKESLAAELDRLTRKQNWMHNIALPFGLFTVKPTRQIMAVGDDPATLAGKFAVLQSKGAKDGMVYELDLGGKRLLDVACGEGKYSLIAALNASYVLGIDIDDIRIEKANVIKRAIGARNVDFEIMNLYGEEFGKLSGFDYALCLGLLHRLPDPFNFINALASKANAILFEWIVAPSLMSQNVPWAYHRPGGLYEWQNASINIEAKEVASRGRAGGGINRASYWNISYGALEAMCQRAGLDYFLRFSRAPMYPDYSEDPGKLTRRVMMVASREPLTILGRTSRAGLIPAEAPRRPL